MNRRLKSACVAHTLPPERKSELSNALKGRAHCNLSVDRQQGLGQMPSDRGGNSMVWDFLRRLGAWWFLSFFSRLCSAPQMFGEGLRFGALEKLRIRDLPSAGCSVVPRWPGGSELQSVRSQELTRSHKQDTLPEGLYRLGAIPAALQ